MNIPLKRYWDLLVVYLKPQRKRALLLAALLLASIALQLINPQLIRYFIDTARAGDAAGNLFYAALLFLGVGISNQIISAYATYVGADVGWNATNRMRSDLARHCLDLDMSFHNERTPGELIERIDGDITALSNFFSQFVIRILGSGLLVLGVLALLFRENWIVGTALTLYAIVAIVVLNKGRGIAVEATAEERQASADLYGFVEERLAGIDDIRANGGGHYVMRRFHQVIQQNFTKGRRAWMMRALLWVIVVALFTVGDVLALGVGISLFGAGAVTLGTVYLLYSYTQLMWNIVEQLTQQLQDFQKATASIGRVGELFGIRRIMQDGTGSPLPQGPLGIQFDDATFAYGDATILKSLSFELKPGRVLGLLGRTGSGKTTLTRLLFRLYDVTAGAVRIGGVDLRDAPMSQIRGRVAMVTQEVQLFHATVRDNLTFFDRSIPDRRIIDVVAELGLDDWYGSLPNGLDTELTAGGGGLSAGEAQLLAFVRVFLQNPGIVILDEPSSRMDLATERLLERAMEKLLQDRTAIIIAHRLSTVDRADEIMILEEGRIREHGARGHLAADPGSRFHALLRAGLHQEMA